MKMLHILNEWQQYIVWRRVQILLFSSVFFLCVPLAVSRRWNGDMPLWPIDTFQAYGEHYKFKQLVTLNIINTRENWYQRWPSTHERIHCWHTVNRWQSVDFVSFRFILFFLLSLICWFFIHFNGSASSIWIFYLHINRRDGLFVYETTMRDYVTCNRYDIHTTYSKNRTGMKRKRVCFDLVGIFGQTPEQSKFTHQAKRILSDTPKHSNILWTIKE